MAPGSDRLYRVLARFHARLEEHREAIDRLDVFPRADFDAGANLVVTVGGALAAVDGGPAGEPVGAAISRGAIEAAEGIAGRVIAQVVVALVDTMERGGPEARPADALGPASRAAARALEHQEEGSMLTVLQEAARAAEGAGDAAALERASRAALEALARTRSTRHPRGGPDAGGVGVVLLLASLLEELGASPPELPDWVLRGQPGEVLVPSPRGGPRFEVTFLLDAEEAAVERMRSRWRELGEQIVVSGDASIWSCHLHTDEAGPAVEAGVAAGRPWNIRVRALEGEARSRPLAPRPAGFRPRAEASLAPIGVVAVAAGAGLSEVFRELGAQAVVSGTEPMHPSTEELVAAVEQVPAALVVLLPNASSVIPLAEEVDGLSRKLVEVVPTRNVQQGVAAMQGYSYAGQDLTRAAEDMAAAASSIVTGEVSRAPRDANIGLGRIRAGDWLGTADGRVVVADGDLEVVLRGLVATILPPFGVEVVTVYTGQRALPSATKSLEAWLTEIHPGVEVRAVPGGQPGHPYLVAVE